MYFLGAAFFVHFVCTVVSSVNLDANTEETLEKLDNTAETKDRYHDSGVYADCTICLKNSTTIYKYINR